MKVLGSTTQLLLLTIKGWPDLLITAGWRSELRHCGRPYRVTMRSSFYCVEHAMSEQLVLASSICDGRSACPDHARSANLQRVPTASGRRVNQCKQCLRVPHLAYFIVDQLPLCIRHAADAVFPEDDMGAHHMAHAAYLRLQVDGVRGTY